MTPDDKKLPPSKPRILEERSDEINLIAGALSNAQGQLDPAELNATNAFLGSSYADLTSVVSTIRQPLAENGLAISQSFIPSEGGTLLATTLLHESGQFIRGFLPLLNVTDWHSLGSAISYARRYSINAMVGVAAQSDDDDAVKAMGQDKPKRKPRARKPSPKNESPLEPTARKIIKTRAENLEEMKKIIDSVDGAADYLRGVGVDPGDPPANIRTKIIALGANGLAMKIHERRKKEEAEAIVAAADEVADLADEKEVA